jgi:hypothetical protein
MSPIVWPSWDGGGEGVGDRIGDGVERSGRGSSDEAFEFGEALLHRVEVGRVFRKKQSRDCDVECLGVERFAVETGGPAERLPSA